VVVSSKLHFHSLCCCCCSPTNYRCGAAAERPQSFSNFHPLRFCHWRRAPSASHRDYCLSVIKLLFVSFPPSAQDDGRSDICIFLHVDIHEISARLSTENLYVNS